MGDLEESSKDSDAIANANQDMSQQSSATIADPPMDTASFQRAMLQLMTVFSQSVNNQVNRQPSPSLGVPHAKEPNVKEPECFSGDTYSLNGFLTQCDLVFALQSSRFANDSVKVKYIISFLRGTPLLAIRPLLLMDPSPIMLNNLQLFTNHLRTTYGDPDEVAVATRKLQDLKQTGPASAYFAEFQQYIAIAGWGSGPVVVHMAIQGLKSHLQDELARIAIRPQTIGELIQFIVPLDNRLFEREQSKRAQTKIAVPRSTTSYASYANVAQFTTAAAVQPNVVGVSRPIPTSAVRSTIIRSPLTAEEKQKRRDNNLCLYCGDAGHLAMSCPAAARKANTFQVKIEDGTKTDNQLGNGQASPN